MVYSISISPPELGTTTEAYTRVELPSVETQHTTTPVPLALLIAVALVAIVVAWVLVARRR